MTPSRRAAVWVAVLWTLVLWMGCSIPGNQIPDVNVLSADKLAHIGLFAVFAVLWARVAPHRSLAIAGWGLAFGTFIEVWQHLLPIGRTGDVYDVIADLIGLALGLGIAGGMARRAPAPA